MSMELRLLSAGQVSAYVTEHVQNKEDAEIEGWRRHQAAHGAQSILSQGQPAGHLPVVVKQDGLVTAFKEDERCLLDFVLQQKESLTADKKLLCLVADNQRASELAAALRECRLFHLQPSTATIRVVVRLLEDLNDALAELSEAESIYCRQIEVNEGRLFVGEEELSLMKERYEELLRTLGVTPGLFSLARQKAASEKEDCLRFLRRNRDALPAIARQELAAADIVIAEPYDFLRFKEMHSHLKDYEIVLLDGAGSLSLRYVQLFMQIAGEAFIYRLGEEPQLTEKAESAFYNEQFASHINWLSGLVKEPSLLEVARGTSEAYSEKTFWSRFYADLREAKEEVVIISPFCWPERLKRLRSDFAKLLERGVKVRLFISDRPRSGETLENVLSELRALGLEPEVVPGLHIKMAFIDHRIAWEGSLNILSHIGSMERMRRFEGPAMVQESLSRLDFGV